MICPSLVTFLDRAKSDVGKQRGDDPTLRRAVVCAQELILRQNSGFQKLSDQPHDPPVGHACAQPIHEMVMVDVVETALYVAFNDPVVRHSVPSAILIPLSRLQGLPDMLQGAVRASAGTKPVRDRPELRLEDWLENCFDRALDDAVLYRGNAQGPELPRFTGFRDELPP